MNSTLKRLTLIEIIKWFIILIDLTITMMLFINIANIKPIHSNRIFSNSIKKENNGVTRDVSLEELKDEQLLGYQSCKAFIQYDVPDINSSFKAYMDYRKITNTSSDQYKLIQTKGYTDEYGFMRVNSEGEIDNGEAYYMIALGSYYGTEIGTKYRIKTDTGKTFYGILADCKDDIHTDPTNRYTTVGTPNVVEFLVDSNTLIHTVKYHGTANHHEPLNGKIISIEKIEFAEC